MGRFGSSEDCIECGRTVDYGELDPEGYCDRCSDYQQSMRNNIEDDFREDDRLF